MGRGFYYKKGQVSLEYIFVIGLSLVLLLPMVVVFYTQSTRLQEDIDLAQAEKIVLELRDAAEEVYYFGAPSQQQIDIYFPEHVRNITITADSINLYYQTLEAPIYAESDAPLNMTGTLKSYPGLHRITVTAGEDGVIISEQT